MLSLQLSACKVSSQSPVNIAGPSIEDAAELLHSVAHPLLASLNSHQAEFDSMSTVSFEAQQAQQHPHAHGNGNGNHAATETTTSDAELPADAVKLQIQVSRPFLQVGYILQHQVQFSCNFAAIFMQFGGKFAHGVVLTVQGATQ